MKCEYLGIYHNPFVYREKSNHIFFHIKNKVYVMAIHTNQSVNSLFDYYFEKYQVLLNQLDEHTIEFESESYQVLEKIRLNETI